MKVRIGDYTIEYNTKEETGYFDLIERLYMLRNDDKLTDEEKNKKLQEIMKEYMG